MNTGQSAAVAILSPVYSDARAHGGITPVVINLSEGLLARGYRVDLLVRLPAERGHLPDPLPAGLRIIDLKSRHKLTTALAVVRYLRREKPRLLLAAGHRFNIAAIWAGRLVPGVPVYLSVHNTISVEAGGGRRLQRRLQTVSRYYPRARGIVTVSRGVANDLIDRCAVDASLVRTIYNPVISERFRRMAAEGPPPHPWFSESVPIIVAVGRLTRQKAFDHLLRCFALVREKRPCRLIILGEGPDRPQLEQLQRELGLAEQVWMPGFVGNPYPFMKAASVLALSSIFEGLALVLVEAMALGTPVVSTDCPSGPAEVLEGGRYGTLVPVGDRAAMVAALEQALDSSPDKALLSSAVDRFTVENVVNQYVDFLQLDGGGDND